MSNFHSDVVVLGAGPAGSATALFLARSGYEVTLLDRASFPRAKACGEYLTPGAVRLLRDEIGILSALRKEGAVPLSHEAIVGHNGRTFQGTTDALACPRTVTDAVLRRTAESAGVRVVEGFTARRILFAGDYVAGVVGEGAEGTATYRAAVTIGADGTRSLLARAMGVVRPIPRLQRLALVGHFAGPPAAGGTGQCSSHDAVTMHLPSDRSDACCGLGVPCGPDGTRNVNIVVPVSEARRLAGRREIYFLDRLRHSFPAVWEQMVGATLAGPLLSVGCFGHHTLRATQHGAALVGDAATFINPFTGEGVYFALRGAQMAAEAIDSALRHGDVSQEAMRSYEAARRRELYPRYQLCDWVQRIVHSPALLAWATERLRRSARLTDVLLRTVGDVGTPKELYSLATLRLALGTI